MNILPKKRWHVRTKENIARVRKDEAEAAEKEKLERQRIENADREARLNLLKEKSKQRLEEAEVVSYEDHEPKQQQHINLFDDLEHAVKTTNKDHDKEVKEKKEEYEKQIGYLTYLGQDTNEALKKKNWYEVPPEVSRFTRNSDIKDTYNKLVLKDQEGKAIVKESDEKDGEIGWKRKQSIDPLNAFKHCCPSKVAMQIKQTQSKNNYTKLTDSSGKHKSKNKKSKKDKIDKVEKLQKLREARLKREMQEKRKTELFLTGLNKSSTITVDKNSSKIKPKYNSQFNPELARQNFR